MQIQKLKGAAQIRLTKNCTSQEQPGKRDNVKRGNPRYEKVPPPRLWSRIARVAPTRGGEKGVNSPIRKRGERGWGTRAHAQVGRLPRARVCKRHIGVARSVRFDHGGLVKIIAVGAMVVHRRPRSAADVREKRGSSELELILRFSTKNSRVVRKIYVHYF